MDLESPLGELLSGGLRDAHGCGRVYRQGMLVEVEEWAEVLAARRWLETARPPAAPTAIARWRATLQRHRVGYGGRARSLPDRPRQGNARASFQTLLALCRSFLFLCLAWTLLNSANRGRRGGQGQLLMG